MYCNRIITILFIVIVSLLLPNIIHAQSMAQTPDCKLDGKIPYVIIGKQASVTTICMQTEDGYQVRKFNDAMAELSRIDLPCIPNDCNQLFFIKQGLTYNAIYQINARNKQLLYSQSLDSNFKIMAAAKLLSVVNNNSESIIETAWSDTKQQICWYYVSDSSDYHNLYYLLYTQNTQDALWRCISIKRNDEKLKIQCIVADYQNIVFAAMTIAKNNTITNASIYHATSSTLNVITIDSLALSNYQIQQFDAVNQKLVCCFLHVPNEDANNYSCTKVEYLLAPKQVTKSKRIALGKITTNVLPSFTPANFLPRQLILAKNGNLILVTEYFENQEIVTNTDVNTGSIGGPFRISRWIKRFSYGDVLLYSISNTDSVLWLKNISKMQTTENDEGVFSSYAAFIKQASIGILFNTLDHSQTLQLAMIDKQANINYAIVSDNKVDAKNLVFKKAKQISNNELIVPAIRQNIFSFVKIRF
jgi:hypothetical protein